MLNEEKVIQLSNGKVNYYWESEAKLPIIEVFIQGKVELAIKIAKELNEEFQAFEVIFETKSYWEDYHAILHVIEMKHTSETLFIKIVNALAKHGAHSWKSEEAPLLKEQKTTNENLLRLTKEDDRKIGEFYPGGEHIFYSQELERTNQDDAIEWIQSGDLVAIVSEIHGGIVGYIHREHAKDVTSVLNLHTIERM